MLIVISPAKKLDFNTPPKTDKFTQPEFISESTQLIRALRRLDAAGVAKLMGLSKNLAELNVRRFAAWKTPFTPDNAKQAILAFKGDVYVGLQAEDFNRRDLDFAQKHLRILSGLYGVLRPLDLMQAYRLEMGTRFPTDKGKDLYAFWGEKITQAINRELRTEKDKTLINLASNEYFKAVRPTEIEGTVITPLFKERRADGYRVIGLLAKRARGMMARHIIKNRITRASDIVSFAADGYRFNKRQSSDTEWVFTREEKAVA